MFVIIFRYNFSSTTIVLYNSSKQRKLNCRYPYDFQFNYSNINVVQYNSSKQQEIYDISIHAGHKKKGQLKGSALLKYGM